MLSTTHVQHQQMLSKEHRIAGVVEHHTVGLCHRNICLVVLAVPALVEVDTGVARMEVVSAWRVEFVASDQSWWTLMRIGLS